MIPLPYPPPSPYLPCLCARACVLVAGCVCVVGHSGCVPTPFVVISPPPPTHRHAHHSHQQRHHQLPPPPMPPPPHGKGRGRGYEGWGVGGRRECWLVSTSWPLSLQLPPLGCRHPRYPYSKTTKCDLSVRPARLFWLMMTIPTSLLFFVSAAAPVTTESSAIFMCKLLYQIQCSISLSRARPALLCEQEDCCINGSTKCTVKKRE